MVGAVRFELTTSCTRNKRASQATLRPDTGLRKVPGAGAFCKEIMPPRNFFQTAKSEWFLILPWWFARLRFLREFFQNWRRLH
jgi:hypothetical protein